MQWHRFGRFLNISLQFWIPLLLTGVALWVGSTWFTERVFSQTYPAEPYLAPLKTHQVNLSFSATVLAIDAEVDRSLRVTEVNIQTGSSSVQEIEFEYPLVEYADIEQAIAQDLGLQISDVRALIRYRLD